MRRPNKLLEEMMIEFTYGKGAGKLSLEASRNSRYLLKLRIPAVGIAHESMAITLGGREIRRLKEVLKSRSVGKLRLGKHCGLRKEYVLVERAEPNDRFKIELHGWLLIFGASLGDRLTRDDADEFSRLLARYF